MDDLVFGVWHLVGTAFATFVGTVLAMMWLARRKAPTGGDENPPKQSSFAVWARENPHYTYWLVGLAIPQVFIFAGNLLDTFSCGA